MVDRSSAPHHQPGRTPTPVVRKIVHLRWKQRLGPVEIGDQLQMPSSTVHAVLVTRHRAGDRSSRHSVISAPTVAQRKIDVVHCVHPSHGLAGDTVVGRHRSF